MGSPRKKPIRTKTSAPAPTPKQPKAWDPPPWPTVCDKSADITYTAVGRALSNWEGVEIALAGLFSALLGIRGDEGLIATRAYGAVITAKGRIDMLQAAADAFFFRWSNDELKKKVHTILEAAVQFSARRNEIAHGQVHEIEVNGDVISNGRGGFFQTRKKLGFALGPSYYATKKTALSAPETLLSPIGRAAKYCYSSAEINLISDKFDHLEKEITFAISEWVSEHHQSQHPP